VSAAGSSSYREIDAYVEANASRFLQELGDLCSFASISAAGRDAVEPCRRWVSERLGALTDRVQTLEAGGMPSVLADLPGEGDRRLLLYTHYDVQPVDPLELWESPPFELAERDGSLYARGVCDDKSDVMARIHAIEALRAVRGRLPVTLRFLVEGEEETGSTTFEAIVERNRDRLAADGCLWESAEFDALGRPQVMFGVRGLLYVHLRVRTLAFDQHSGFASLFPSASLYMVNALASLSDTDLNVRIRGFYDEARPPTPSDRQMIAGIHADLEAYRQLVGFERPVRDVAAGSAVEQLLFTPTYNVAGVHSGYGGPGSKTVLPAEAEAKIDFRLVPDQDPAQILQKLRQHFDDNGFERVEIEGHEAERPMRSDPESLVGRAALEAERDLRGEAVQWPFMPATGPMWVVAGHLGVPTVMPCGAGRPGSRVHAPNENIAVRDYLDTVRLCCRVFERFGSS
jgi:acetylornithine deacetylase/succinyl-diaminopimelate desuccinylase-like protein